MKIRQLTKTMESTDGAYNEGSEGLVLELYIAEKFAAIQE